MSLIPLMAAALAQELNERGIAALDWPICEDIIRGVLERTSNDANRLLQSQAGGDSVKTRPDDEVQ